jgi:hypothetical protein
MPTTLVPMFRLVPALAACALTLACSTTPEPAPLAVTSSDPWLPAFDELDLTGFATNRDVLAEYWGAHFSEFEATLCRFSGEQGAARMLDRSLRVDPEAPWHEELVEYGYDRLQGRDRFLEHVPGMLLASFDSGAGGQQPYGFAVSRLAGVERARNAGYDVDGVVRSLVRSEVGREFSREVWAAFQPTVERVQRTASPRIAPMVAELEALAARLHAAIRDVVVRDVAGITPTTRSATGELFVGPFIGTSIRPELALDISATPYLVRLTAGTIPDVETKERLLVRNHWLADYVLDLRKVEELAPLLEEAVTESTRLSAAIRAIVVEELERGA